MTDVKISSALGPLSRSARISWASEVARSKWSSRFQDAASACRQLAWHSVVAGLRSAAIGTVLGSELEACTAEWEQAGLDVVPLELRCNQRIVSDSDDAFEFVVGIVQTNARTRFLRAWESEDLVEITDLLGFPPCCARSLAACQGAPPMTDLLWFSAMAAKPGTDDRTEMHCAPEINLCLSAIGIRLLPHLPCRFDCTHSIESGRKMLRLGQTLDCAEALGWAFEALSWPLEWSCMHGIAEIRTPVCRIVTSADYTAQRYTIRFLGSRIPEEAARGLEFPYRNIRPNRLTGSTGFRRGLANDE
jgi:hypothetical protein